MDDLNLSIKTRQEICARLIDKYDLIPGGIARSANVLPADVSFLRSGARELPADKVNRLEKVICAAANIARVVQMVAAMPDDIQERMFQLARDCEAMRSGLTQEDAAAQLVQLVDQGVLLMRGMSNV